jgi:hypothetical protein
MVKVSLTGKRQTTTQALGAGIARWIMQAGCGVMVLIGGELVAVQAFGSVDYPAVCDADGVSVSMSQCRIYRSTVQQIKSLIGLA